MVCKFIVRKSSGNFSARSKMYAHLKGNHNIDKDQNARFDNITDHREKEDKSENGCRHYKDAGDMAKARANSFAQENASS